MAPNHTSAALENSKVSFSHGLGPRGLHLASALSPWALEAHQAAGVLWEHPGGCRSQRPPTTTCSIQAEHSAENRKSGRGPHTWRARSKPRKPCWVRRHPVTPEQSAACSSPGELLGHGADGHSAGWCPSTRLQEDLSDDLLSGPILPFAPEGVQQKTRSLRRIPPGCQRGRHLTAPLRGLVLHE